MPDLILSSRLTFSPSHPNLVARQHLAVQYAGLPILGEQAVPRLAEWQPLMQSVE